MKAAGFNTMKTTSNTWGKSKMPTQDYCANLADCCFYSGVIKKKLFTDVDGDSLPTAPSKFASLARRVDTSDHDQQTPRLSPRPPPRTRRLLPPRLPRRSALRRMSRTRTMKTMREELSSTRETSPQLSRRSSRPRTLMMIKKLVQA